MLRCDLCRQRLPDREVKTFALSLTRDETLPLPIDLRLHELCAARMRRDSS